jgi:hypothetical protein
MLKSGMKVVKLTKKVGQVAPSGTITAIHGDSVEVKWDDGHTSIVSRISVVPATTSNHAK